MSLLHGTATASVKNRRMPLVRRRFSRGATGGQTGVMALCLRAEADHRRGPLRKYDFLAYQSAYRIRRCRRRRRHRGGRHRFVLRCVAVITALHVDVPVSIRITFQRRW